MSDTNFEDFKKRSKELHDLAIEKTKYPPVLFVKNDLDSVVNFKVNSILKREFDSLCKANHTSMSREIKRFMTEAVRIQRLL